MTHAAFERCLLRSNSQSERRLDKSVIWSIGLFRFAVGYLVKQGGAVGLGPQAHLSSDGRPAAAQAAFAFAALTAWPYWWASYGFQRSRRGTSGRMRRRA
jgi:hypothetical protein